MIVVYILGFLWAFPATLLGWVFFCIPNLFKDTFTDVWIDQHLCITWEIDKQSKFYNKAMAGWFGFVIGCNRIVVDIDLPTRMLGGVQVAEVHKDHPHYKQMQHELKHVFQNYIWGIFFYPLYIWIALYLRFFTNNKHAHINHPFEVSARRFAGQRINIPRENWYDGISDRWPWW